ncbi:hypothetical protein AB1Y20_006257 [Prymnesium parvum]|uniref:UBX domain-containing protein n=1 Tax=Prymnesium parvum TaxID=97485 RepID=A0AB34J1S0_PRYPA
MDSIDEFVVVTGADRSMAEQLLATCDNDVAAAVALFFDQQADDSDGDSGDDSSTPADAPPEAAAAQLPTEPVDLVGPILENARKETPPPPARWGGTGRPLGSAATPTEESAPPPPQAGGALPERHNPKKVRVIFWADGFTVEDTTEEEAAAAPGPSAPRRTGIATLGDSRSRAQAIPAIPSLRKYEEHKQFMEDLKRGIPPAELREIDLSSGIPRPRPVDIMLGDMRPAPYPSEAAARQAAMAAQDASSQPPKPALKAFSGEGYTLSRARPAEEEAAPGEEAMPSAWLAADRPVEVDLAAPTTLVQVRLDGLPPLRLQLNNGHTVADLKALIERRLAETGEAPRAYTISSGFPPTPLTDDQDTLEGAGLLNAAVSHRWK